MTSNGNNPSLASKRIVIFIERPLMTGSEPSGLSNSPRVAMETEGAFCISSLRQGKRET